MKKLFWLLACLPLAACEFESEGGDTDGGISACPATKGEGTWTNPQGTANVAGDQKAELAKLNVPAGLSTNFTEQGGTLSLTVQLEDANGNLLYEGLKSSDFSLDGELSIQKLGSLTSGGTTATGEIGELRIGEPKGDGASVILVFDSSASNTSTDPKRLRVTAGQKFVSDMPEGTLFAAMDFGVSSSWTNSIVSSCFKASRYLIDFTTDKDAVKLAIERVTAAGGTPLYKALNDAVKLVEGITTQGATEADIIVFTDGEASDYQESDAKALIARANKVNARLHSVALSTKDEDSVDLQHLQTLAAKTGGISLAVAKAEELQNQFDHVASVTTSPLDIALDVSVSTESPLPKGLYNVQGKLQATFNGATASSNFTTSVEVQ